MQFKAHMEEVDTDFDYELSEADILSIEEGLAQAKRGETIPHEAVRAWVYSLGTNNPLPMPSSAQFKK